MRLQDEIVREACTLKGQAHSAHETQVADAQGRGLNHAGFRNSVDRKPWMVLQPARSRGDVGMYSHKGRFSRLYIYMQRRSASATSRYFYPPYYETVFSGAS